MPPTKYFQYYKNNSRIPRMTLYRRRQTLLNGRRQITRTTAIASQLNETQANETPENQNEKCIANETTTETRQNQVEQDTNTIEDETRRFELILENTSSDPQLSEELLCQCLISLSYAANLTHSALSLVAELANLISDFSNIPKKFRHLNTRVSEDNLNYTKIWIC